MAGRESPAWRRRIAGAALAGGLALVAPGLASAATLKVKNTNDAGAGSLRKAIEKANDEVGFPGRDRIEIKDTGTVELATALPTLSSKITISGPGAGSFAVSRAVAAPLFRILFVAPPGNVKVSGIAIKKGHAVGADGGGIRNEGKLNLSRVLVTRNSVDAGAGTAGGGGIFNQGTLRVLDSTLSKNEAFGSVPYGSGIYSYGPKVVIRGSTLTGNSGNGAYNGTAGETTLANSTISDNPAIGIVQGGGTITLQSSTVASNDGMSGFEYNITVFNASSTMSFQNTIVGPAPGSANCYSSGGPTLTSHGHNLSSDGTCGFVGAGDQLNAMPKLAPLAANGGPTKTRAIAASSDAHDAGKSGSLNRDQRGKPRPINHAIPNAPGGNGADIGAFERQ